MGLAYHSGSGWCVVVLAVWGIAGPVAWGSGVHVDDTVGCLQPEVVELELRSAIGDEVVDRVDLRVKLSGTEHWRLELEVLDGRGSLWNRVVAVEPVDCPYLTALVTQSVERGLTDLPGWDLSFRPPPSELGVVLAVTMPWAPQIGLGGDLWVPVRGMLHWDFQIDVVAGLLERFASGTVRLTATTLATGPGLDLPLPAGALRLATRVGAGASVAVGGAPTTLTRLRPRALVTTDAGWAADTGFRAALRVELPIVRLCHERDEEGDCTLLEPPLRMGLVVEIAGPLRRSDVGTPDGP